MIPLEYIKTNGKKVVLDLYDISMLEEFDKYTLVHLKTGAKVKLKEHISEINTDINFALKDVEVRELINASSAIQAQ